VAVRVEVAALELPILAAVVAVVLVIAAHKTEPQAVQE
jgi:hypothetical protein